MIMQEKTNNLKYIEFAGCELDPKFILKTV